MLKEILINQCYNKKLDFLLTVKPKVYKCNLEAWTIKENGDIDPAPDLFEYGKVDIY